jgi:hypothetical protein
MPDPVNGRRESGPGVQAARRRRRYFVGILVEVSAILGLAALAFLLALVAMAVVR